MVTPKKRAHGGRRLTRIIECAVPQRTLPSLLCALLCALLFATGCKQATPGCTKDSDCKGRRVCVSGDCREPPAASASSSAAPLTATAPVASGDAAAPLKYYVKVPKGFRNGVVKAGPNAKQSVGELPRGTAVALVGRDAGELWYEVRWPYPDGTNRGWMHKDTLVKASEPGAGECALESDESCAADLVVQIAAVAESTPPGWDFPDVQRHFVGRSEFKGVKLVAFERGRKQYCGAIVQNRCMADTVIAFVNERLHSGAFSRCEKVEVTRVLQAL